MAGQPIPELRQEDPLLGVSTLATGIPNEPEPELELVEPSIGLSAEIPLIEPTVGPPVTAALTPQPVAAPPRLASIPTIAPDVPIAPPVEVPRIAPAFAEAQATVQTLSAEQDDLRTTARGILHDLATESDPVKRAALDQQADDNATAQQTVTADLNTARSISDTEEVVEAQRLGDAQAKLRQDAALRVREDSLAMDEANRASDAEALRQTDNVRQEATEAKERHVEILKRGPRESFTTTALAMVTEALQPLAFGSEPDFNKAIDRLVASNRQAWQDEQAAAIAEIGTAGDAVGDIGRQERERKIQQSVIRESHIEQLVLELDREIATTTDEFRAEKARTVRDSLKREQAAEQARLDVLARDKARRIAAENIKLRKVEADIALTGAKIGTERAKAAKAAAEAAKLARRGGRKVKGSSLFGAQIGQAVKAGQLDEKGAKLVFQQGVIDPITGDHTLRKNGSFVLATSAKSAEDLNRQGAKVKEVTDLVNQALAIRGAQGWEPTGKFIGSAAGKRMQAIGTTMLLIQKDVFNLGQITEGEIDMIKQLNGGDLTGMQDPRPVLLDMQKRMVKGYNGKRKSLAKGSQPIRFPTVTSAPARSLRDVDTLLNQAPNLKTGDAPSVAEREGALGEKYELLIQKHGGDTKAASEEFTEDMAVTRKRAEADRSELNDAFNDALPDNWSTLVKAAGKAALARQALGPDATGTEINAAEALEKRTLRAAENSMSPRAKKLRTARKRQSGYLDSLTGRTTRELERQAESRKLAEEKKVADERERRLGELPTAGKI